MDSLGVFDQFFYKADQYGVISMIMGYDKSIHIFHITPMETEPLRCRRSRYARIKENSFVTCLYVQTVAAAP